jgi:bla regulator protein BlaR1
MPWNLPLWWQMVRLRRAIEVDCDARVLMRGHDARSYSEILIDVGRQRSGYVGAVAGMSESKLFLEERIKLMVSKRLKWWPMPVAALAGLSLALITVAAEVGPPNASSAEGGPAVITMDASVLDHYAGAYQMAPSAVLTVTREGSGLFAQLTGQQKFEVYPRSETEFFYKVVEARITFDVDSSGRSSGLVLHQNGVDHRAPRIDAATARQVADSLAARIQAQTPMPGSEAAVRHLVAGVASGNPNYEEMSPELAKAVREQLPTLRAVALPMGAVTSVEFTGVGSQGWDSYRVKHEHGVSQVRIMLDSKGTIIGALSTVGP